jgi:hypothetical protein
MHQLKEKGIFMVTQDQERIPLSMTTIAELSGIMQTLFTTTADALAKKQALSNGSGK